MLAHAKEMLEYQNGHMSINQRFNKLGKFLSLVEIAPERKIPT
jgi:hypothetical protein